ncbi:putative titin [Fasciola gigantica]|uniref:Putative titin n=1 Tax=Fasciola gigantica TaxID=46835 RepID=A0A504YGV6_FASGI|nr:putative titin [Fasciola gigantica]
MLTFLERPTIHTSMEPILVKQNGQVLLPCQATGTQPIRVQWLLPSGQLITADQPGQFRLLPDQVSITPEVNLLGIYLSQCNGQSRGGKSNSPENNPRLVLE